MSPHSNTNLVAVPSSDDVRERVASSIQALAQIQGLAHSTVAEMAQMDPTAFSKALSLKRNIRADELERIGRALGAPVNLLYLGEDEIRRRAMAGVGIIDIDGPRDPAEQVTTSFPWMYDDSRPALKAVA